MSKLKEIKARISSVSSTMQITSAMKSVSASKLKKEQQKIQAIKPYVVGLTGIIDDIISSSPEGSLQTPFCSQKNGFKHVLLVFFTSDRGLCGAFNANVLKKLKQKADTYIEKGIKVTLLPIGKKGAKSSVLKSYDTIKNEKSDLLNEITFKNASEKTKWLLDMYLEGTYDKIDFVYNSFVNAGVQTVEHLQFLPVNLTEGFGLQEEEQVDELFVYEPDKNELLSSLIPKFLAVELYKVIVDSLASEHGARMTAMHKATENAKDLKADLSVRYNKARQAAVTTEIIEISSGADALSA